MNHQLSTAPDDLSLMDRKVRLDLPLADYFENICEAARVKAGLKHHGVGERPSKYFSALLKQRSSNSTVTPWNCSRNGVPVSLTNIEDILEEASSFMPHFILRSFRTLQKLKLLLISKRLFLVLFLKSEESLL